MWLEFGVIVLSALGPIPAADIPYNGSVKTFSVWNNEAKLTVEYPTSFFLSSPKPIRIVVHNIGANKILYHMDAIPNEFDVVVLDLNGQSIPRTRYGKKGPRLKGMFMGPLLTLAPGQKFEFNSDVLRSFDMSVAEEYVLSINSGFTMYIEISKIGGTFGFGFGTIRHVNLVAKDIKLKVEATPR